MSIDTLRYTTTRRRSARHPTLRLGAVALALAALQGPAWALDYVWNGSGGFWDEAGKWSLLGVPGSGDTATINGTGTNTLLVRDPRSVDTLYLNGGNLAGSATLAVGTLNFGSGRFGTSAAQAGAVMSVAGTAVFNGSQDQGIDYSHVVNLGGNTSWTQGNGRLSVGQAYSQGNQSFAAAVLNIASGTTFTDEGAATAGAYKKIGGGTVNNSGTYLRRGLGETFAQSFNNTGTIDIQGGTFSFDGGNFGSINNSSSGQILVASGSTLGLAGVNLSGGSVVNNGLVRQYAGSVVVGAAVQIGGAWQVDGGALTIEGAHTLDSLVMNGSRLTGPGLLNTGSLVFNAGTLGGQGTANGSGLVVNGPATFDGTGGLVLDYNYALSLAGDSRWTAGNGRISVAQSSTSGPAASLNIGAGTTFTDEGAAAASGTKVLSGIGPLTLVNAGTYVRSGPGTTEATGFNNAGTLRIAAGTFLVDASFSNTGQVDVAAGAVLAGYQGALANAGLLTGTGTVKTFRAFDALASSGTIDPGAAAAAAGSIAARGASPLAATEFGTLTIDGGLSLTDSAVLRIDLGANGESDRLAVTGSVLWNGELSVWAGAGTTLELGEVFTIATVGQRLSNSSFDSISWHGLSAEQFSVEYTADGITLRVTAVPEPQTFALWGVGLVLIGALKTRRRAMQPV